MDMHGYSNLFEKGSSRLIFNGTNKGIMHCLHAKVSMGKFIALAEI